MGINKEIARAGKDKFGELEDALLDQINESKKLQDAPLEFLKFINR